MIGQGQAVDHAGALLLDVEDGHARQAELGLEEERAAGVGMIGRDGVHNDQIDLVEGEPGVGHGVAAGVDGQIGRGLVGLGVAAAANARALDDELVAGVHHLHHVEVGDHAGRDVTAGTEDVGGGHWWLVASGQWSVVRGQ
jgi:hypothetical protein